MGWAGEGGGAVKSKAKIVPRKFLIKKIYSYGFWLKQNIYAHKGGKTKDFHLTCKKQKKLAFLKIPTPLPHHFSNGPSLRRLQNRSVSTNCLTLHSLSENYCITNFQVTYLTSSFLA